MIIGVTEWGAVNIYEDIDAALREWGNFKMDLASDVIMLFEPDGRRYEPHYLLKRHPLLFWSQRIVDFGLRLTPSVSIEGDSLLSELNDRATELEQNQFFSSLDEVKEFVRNAHAGT